ncbi:MAG: hypothetical protein A3F17_00370 [Gammaproteobacteria bacterium RIFCSPHIGHO2_12_FULL_41_15]|nr:MAG: hypothetical protein A3F17_00370 [Gammaproteobacteria bacterium RIFCSPHIGHO2_12_FULL_41_15]
MSTKSTIPLSPTTLQVLFNDWLALHEIMAEITQTRKQKQLQYQAENPISPFTLLTATQIHDGFYGPYHGFIRSFGHAYALISKLRTHLTTTQDENIKTHIKDSDLNLPERIKIDTNAAALDKLQRTLDDLARKHFPQWQECVIRWREQLIMQLTLHDITLSDLEIEDLSHPETLSEMLDRFTELKLTPPKVKGDAYTFSDFFRCKAILSIHSAYHRQHKSYEMEEILKIVNKFKNDFKQIDKEQKQLLDATEKDIEAILQPLYAS